MTDSNAVQTQAPPAIGRLVSLDALRGFDMFWIVGAEELVKSLNKISESGFTGFLASQLRHKGWEGFGFYDLIFPLFVFLVGVSLVFSLTKIMEKEGKVSAHIRVIRRFVLLYLAGVFYNGGFSHPWPDMRLLGVLQRLALCYFFASLLFIHLKLRGMIIACVVALVSYWALLSFVPIPGATEISFQPDQNWANYIDHRFLPGRMFDKTWDPEGLLSTIPAVGSCLLGVFTGLLLKNKSIDEKKKVLYLIGGGAALVILGFLWGLQFPVIKKIWTSSYVLVAGGYSAMLMGLFYLVIDVWKYQKWSTPFIWIGANALTIYLGGRFIDFDNIAERLAGGDIKALFGAGGDLMITIVSFSLVFVFLNFLYRKRIFLRL